MYYTNFPDKVTAKYRIVIDHWPLKRFCSPADLSTKNEVEVLLQAWTTGSARFRRLNDKEWEQWHLDRVEALTEEQAAAANSRAEEMEDDDMEGGSGESDHPRRITTDTHNAGPESFSHFLPYLTSSPPTSSLERVDITQPLFTPSPEDAATSADTTPSISFIHHTTATGSRKRQRVPDNNGPPKRKVSAVNTMTFVDGTSGDSVVSKPQRKPRSDKGVKRGPRNAKATGGSA